PLVITAIRATGPLRSSDTDHWQGQIWSASACIDRIFVAVALESHTGRKRPPGGTIVHAPVQQVGQADRLRRVHVVTEIQGQGHDLQLTQYDDRGWRATCYATGMEHSPTSATGTRGNATAPY